MTEKRNEWLFTEASLQRLRNNVYQDFLSQFQSGMSFEDHQKYVVYYEGKLIEASKKVGFNRYQRYTALAYYQRLYTQTTIWEIQPQIAILSCLFIVSKLVVPTTLDELLSKLDFPQSFYDQFQPKQTLTDLEIRVCSYLNFKLMIHLPFTVILGILDGKTEHPDQVEMVSQHAMKLLMTDAPLLYPTGPIAVASIARYYHDDVEKALSFVSDTMNDDEISQLRIDVQTILNLKYDPMDEATANSLAEQIARESSAFQEFMKTGQMPDTTQKTELPPV